MFPPSPLSHSHGRSARSDERDAPPFVASSTAIGSRFRRQTALQALRVIGVSLALIFFCVHSAAAQSLPGSIEIGGGGGRFYGGSFAKGTTRAFSQKVEVDDDILKGIWLGAQWNAKWGVEVAVRRSTEDLILAESGVFPNEPKVGTIDIATIEVLAIRSFPHGNFAPYVGFGGGVTNLDINVADRNVRDVNRFGGSLALGAKFHAVRWLGFRIDARFRATYLGTRSEEDGGWTDTNRWFKNSEVLGGVFFTFPTK
jgi:hypothetical protein